MVIYVLAIIISIFFAFLAENVRRQYNNNKTNKLKISYIILCVLSFLPPFLVSGFRDYSVGTDTSGTYKEIYNVVLYGGDGIRDFGYAFLNRIAIWLFDGYYGLLIITSFIFCALSFKSIFSESKYPTLSVILFFATNLYFLSMNMIRQSIAISIFILSIPHIKNKSFFKFLFLNLIAVSIHSITVIYFIIYFLLNRRIKINHIIIVCLVVAIFGSLFSSELIEFLCSFSYFRKYFAWYFTSQFATGELNLFSLLINVFILLFLIAINKSAKDDKDYNNLLCLETLSVVSLLLSPCLPMMQRISWLFSFPIYIYLPKMFDYISDKRIRRITQICVVLCFIIYMVITTFVRGYNEVVPYTSIF